MRRRRLTTAFAALAFVAGSSVAGSLLPDDAHALTAEECRSAWAASEAYGVCGDRVSITGSGPGQPESVNAVGDICKIATSCLYYTYSDIASLVPERWDTGWQGGLDDVSRLKNCKGALQLSC